jgi:hypothetical protein
MSKSLNGPILAGHSFCKDKSWLEKGLFDFLMSQLMNDIIRQWISKPGEFVLRYDWIDPRQPAEFWKNVIQDYFKDSFDFPIQDVVIL